MIRATHIRPRPASSDHDGNVTTDDHGYTLKYDAWNRLVEVDSGMTVLKTYTFDGLGRRVTENAPGYTNPIVMMYSGTQVIEEDTGASGATLHVQYVWSPVYVDAMVLRDFDFDGGATLTYQERIYALQDANWNITGMVNEQTTQSDSNLDGHVDSLDLTAISNHWQAHGIAGGDEVGDFNHDGNVDSLDLTTLSNDGGHTGTLHWAITERMVYDAYGKSTVLDPSWAAATDVYAWNYGTQGLRVDPVTGLAHADMRDLSLDMMRWIQQDPMGYIDGPNDYIWERDNPVNRVDPTGTTTSDAFEKYMGFRVKKAYGLDLQAIAQFKIWGLPGIQAGQALVAMFFADTSEIAIYSVSTGLAKAVRDLNPKDALGKPFEGGVQTGLGLGPEVATLSGPGPADAASYEGDFHTVQAGATIPIGVVPVTFGAGVFWGDKDATGGRWWGGGISVGPPVPGPPHGGGTIDWNYLLLGKIKLTDHGTPGKCAYYALLTAMPDIPELA